MFSSSRFSLSRRPGLVALTAGLGLVAGSLAAGITPALANPGGTDLVISEVYGGGGNAGATLTHDFVELYNPTGAPISAAGLTITYYSSSGAAQGNHTLTSGTVPAGGHFLVQEAAGTGGTEALPDPDAEGPLGLSGTNGSIEVTRGTAVVDLVGWGTATRREGTATPALTNTTSASRVVTRAQPDTDNNAADFQTGSPTPTGSGAGEEEPPPAEDATIAEIQGPGAASPLAGQTVTTQGVVTAAYPRGDLFAFVIQTEGTGAGEDATPGASDALWVFQTADGVDAEIGQFVEVTGVVGERFGRTQLTYDPAAAPLAVLDEVATPVTALATEWWPTETEREAHESELVDLSGQAFTVTNNFNTNRFGEVGLATGSRPLITPTEVANPVWDPAGYQAVVSDNLARGVVLDDGADWDYQSDDVAQAEPLPWIDRTTTARVGAAAEVTGPMIVDFGFGDWRLQPTSQVNGPAPELISFEDTRPATAEPQDVGGDLTIATFNVLNYFNTTGADYEAAGGSCDYFTDRAGDEVTVDGCSDNGPRGAAEADDLQRQQDKIVAAINALDASVVSLEEIENSVALGEDRDDALAALTDALNDAAGSERWAYVPSPPASGLPPVEQQDVIRTAFIYDPSAVELVGGSRVLVDSPAFSNARQPLAQAFAPVGAGDTATDAFAVIVNHFKSKGSACAGEPNGPQGNCNQSRINQARALADFADAFSAERGLDKVYLTGDFNAYTEEDPMLVLENRGYTQLESDTADEWSYSFDGMSGSLDHVLANDAALDEVTGVDIWEINANEALAYEYSRFNYNVTQFYSPDVFRASDHNPELVGVDVRDASDVALTLSPSRIKQKKQTSTATVTVTGEDGEATGTVRFLVDGVQVARRALLDGTASVPVGPFAKGSYQVTVDYLGDDDNLPGSDTATLVVS